LKKFAGYFHKSTSDCGSRHPLEENHLLARALKSKSHFSVKKDIVKERAFLPNFNETLKVYEASSFRIDGLSNQHIWTHLKENVLINSGDKFYGRADISVSAIYKSKLKIREDDTPLRHVGIIGWPNDDKSARKAIAMELAKKSTLHINKIVL